MVSSQTIDIAIGMALVFLTLSVVVSSINEVLATILKTRFTTLQSALVSLLGSDTAHKVIQHPAIPAAPNGGRKQPSYIEPSYFTVALLDTVAPGTAPSATVARVKQLISDPQVQTISKDAAQALISFADHSGGDYGTFVAHVSGWFDAYMDRVSGEYKRRSHRIALYVSIAVVVILNADSVKYYRQLSAQPAYSAAVAANADAIVKKAQLGLSPATNLGTQVDDVNKAVALVPVPLGWHVSEIYRPDLSSQQNALALALKLVGLVITIVAASMGAPFWFDALGKLANVRGSGARPDPAMPQPPATSVPPPAPVAAAVPAPAPAPAPKAPEP